MPALISLQLSEASKKNSEFALIYLAMASTVYTVSYLWQTCPTPKIDEFSFSLLSIINSRIYMAMLLASTSPFQPPLQHLQLFPAQRPQALL